MTRSFKSHLRVISKWPNDLVICHNWMKAVVAKASLDSERVILTLNGTLIEASLKTIADVIVGKHLTSALKNYYYQPLLLIVVVLLLLLLLLLLVVFLLLATIIVIVSITIAHQQNFLNTSSPSKFSKTRDKIFFFPLL